MAVASGYRNDIDGISYIVGPKYLDPYEPSSMHSQTKLRGPWPLHPKLPIKFDNDVLKKIVAPNPQVRP